MVETQEKIFDTEKFFEKSYKESNIAEFFRRNLQMLGYSGPVRNLTTIVHEFVTNGLDACEESGIIPEITVELKDAGEREMVVSVQDNGIGIPEDYISKILGQMLSGTKFHRYIQSRGQQGIGAVGAIMFAHMTSGKPTKIISSTGNGKIVTAVMDIDIKNNKPIVFDVSKRSGKWRGTKIISHYKDVLYNKGEQGVLEYIRRTAIANPHAKIRLVEPDGNIIVFERAVDAAPKKPMEMQRHPLGITADDLRIMVAGSSSHKLSGFLKSELSRVSDGKIDEIRKLAKTVDFEMNPKELTHQQAEEIVNAFKKVKFMAPSTEGLVPIGEAQMEKSLKGILEPEFYSVVERRPAVYQGGIPFQVEVGLAYSGKAGHQGTDNTTKAETVRFANRVPLTFDTGGCAITQAVKTVEWKRYNISDFESSPITVMVNIISPHIPYTSAGKQAIADDPDILNEIRFALMDAGRKLRRHLIGLGVARRKAMKRAIFYRYIPEVAHAVGKLSDESEKKLEKALRTIVDKKLQTLENTDEEDVVEELAEGEGPTHSEEEPTDDEEAAEGGTVKEE